MPYSRTTWVDGTPPAINAANLNNIEAGLVVADANATAAVPKSTVTTAGDLIYATGSAAVTRLAVGSASQVLAGGASAPAWVLPPGYEIAYDQITSTVNIASTTEATPTAIITGTSKTYEAVPYLFHFFAPYVQDSSAANGVIRVLLMEDGASIGRILTFDSITAATQIDAPCVGELRFTPTAAAHTFGIAAWTTSTTGTPQIGAGAGGINTDVPAFLRVTKV